jgi:outer membrane protein insertion porin family
MRRLIAPLVGFAVAAILHAPLCAQTNTGPGLPDTGCSASSDDKPAGPEISVQSVYFSGSLQIPVSEQEAIADSVRQTTRSASLEEVSEEALERAKTALQDRGYFKAEVTGETRILASSPVSEQIALILTVEEGAQYRLRSIGFRNNRAIKNAKYLRGLFPIADGEIFSRAKIARGLDNVRRTYSERGYVNFTSVPDTRIDEEARLISLVVDMDEGRQFHLQQIVVLGLADSAREDLLKSLPIQPGQLFTGKAWEGSLISSLPMFPDCPCRQQQKLDERDGLVTLTLDFRPCSAE